MPTTVLLRNSSPTAHLKPHLVNLEVRVGSITDPATLRPAMQGVTHVIHCAGCTKASRNSEYYAINQNGTGNLVGAVNAQGPAVQQLVCISSLAASGPATPDSPAREESTPKPVSDYGRSKLAGESEVRNGCRTSFTILRPPAVYGPRDTGFFPMFEAVKKHLLPRPGKRQALSLVFVRDLAEAVVACLDNPQAARKTYFVSSKEIVTSRAMAERIAQLMKVWTIPVPLPSALLWPICLVQDLRARLTGRASLLNLQKFAELRAPGWVCDPARLEMEIGFKCGTALEAGLAQTIQWYRQAQWL
jgi:dihydroflavonol-4-reductase